MTESEQRHFEVVLEQILHEVKTVAEGHEVLRNEVKASHRELEEKIDLNASVIKFGFETLDAKIDGVKDELKETREVLSAKIQTVGDKVNGIAREGALGQKVNGHEERIMALERKVA